MARSEKALSADEILAQMASVYANCQSYVDTGKVETLFIHPNRKRTVTKPFSTAFIRPSALRFEFKSRRGEKEWDSYIVWSRNNTVKTWWSIQPEIKEQPSLIIALAGATGVSGGSAYTIPTLLMPDLIKGRKPFHLKNAKLIGDEVVSDVAAYKIQGTRYKDHPTTAWIDKKRFLILKIFEKKKIKDFETETTTTYTPHINVKVDPKKLEFNIPKKEN